MRPALIGLGRFGAQRFLSTATACRLPTSEAPAHRQVTNQSKPLTDSNAYDRDIPLKEAVATFGGAWAEPQLQALGGLIGREDVHEFAAKANQNKPVLKTHDSNGRRINFVDFHPTYHVIMALGIEHKVHSFAWNNPTEPGNHVARSALGYLAYPVESGTQCPQTMTYACVPPLRNHLTEAQRAKVPWDTLATRPVYDPDDKPAHQKEGVTIGMSMTERQGGSDVRANTTVATPEVDGVEGPGEVYRLNGHKWFTSAPMCDAFLTLAQTQNGLSCFLVPRWIPGTEDRNEGLHFIRLKDKLGDLSNASSEVEYHNAYAEMLGQEGRGIQTIIEMVQHTRIDTCVGSASLMRRCVAEAAHHTGQRTAFGKVLSETPIMRNVLCDLAVEAEAATLLGFRISSTFNYDAPEQDRLLGRIGTAIAKYHICKRAPGLAYEAMECFGGNGYIEDFPMARLYRQAPLNAIWEGSGNVICLDVLRCASKEPETLEAFFAELSDGRQADERLAKFCRGLETSMKDVLTAPENIRSVVSMMGTAWQAALLLKHGHPAVAEAFLSSRLAPPSRLDYGTLDRTTDFESILQRA